MKLYRFMYIKGRELDFLLNFIDFIIYDLKLKVKMILIWLKNLVLEKIFFLMLKINNNE